MITCGLDEAGRGALAGPLVAAAVILKEEIKEKIEKRKLKIKDGKLLTPAQRVQIYKKLQGVIIVESISARSINNHGIGWANKEFKKYHWKINKGYGTKIHIEAIRKNGLCRYHRSIFVTTALRSSF